MFTTANWKQDGPVGQIDAPYGETCGGLESEIVWFADKADFLTEDSEGRNDCKNTGCTTNFITDTHGENHSHRCPWAAPV